MADYFYTMELTKTNLISWFAQQDRKWTVSPLGDVLLAALAVEAYRIYGILELTTELRTFNRANEIAEYFKLADEYFDWYPYTGDRVVYCRTDDHGNFWLVPDRPFVKNRTGENKSVIDFFGRLIGDTTSHQAGFSMEDVDEATNDWNI